MTGEGAAPFPSIKREVLIGECFLPISVRLSLNIPDGELKDFQGAFSSLTPVFTVSKGAAVTVGEDRQVSGTSSLDFTAPAVYMVTAPDGRKKLYEASFKSGTLAYIPDSNFRKLLKSKDSLTFSGDWLNTDGSSDLGAQ